MKKAVRSNPGNRRSMQAPAATVNTVAAKLNAKPQQSAADSPTPGWTRYVDSRLKQFCLR